MNKQDRKYLKRLLETPSPTGCEQCIAAMVRERMEGVADQVTTDVMGSVHARLAGRGSAPSLMLAAHMDEIGLMVVNVSDDGFLSMAAIGGVDAAILPGLRVDVHATGVEHPLRGIVGRKPIHLISAGERDKVTPLSDLVIDLGLPAKKVKRLVKVGDVITFGVGFERFGKNMGVSRAFDDKCGVWVITRVLEELASGGGCAADVTCACTVQEEIGTRGAITSAFGIRPDVAVAFDVTHATDYPGISHAKFGDIKCGGGPVIGRGPNVNPQVFERLVQAAKTAGVPYQIEALPGHSGTDAWPIQVSRAGIPTGLVSVPLRYMHTPTEVICLDDLDATVALFVQFARDLESGGSFVPMAGCGSASLDACSARAAQGE